jgi:hypothetical protein
MWFCGSSRDTCDTKLMDTTTCPAWSLRQRFRVLDEHVDTAKRPVAALKRVAGENSTNWPTCHRATRGAAVIPRPLEKLVNAQTSSLRVQPGCKADKESSHCIFRPFQAPVPVLAGFILRQSSPIIASAPLRIGSSSHKEAMPSAQSLDRTNESEDTSDESPIDLAKRGAVPTLFVGHVYTNGAVNVMGVQKMHSLVEDMFHNLLNNRDASTVELLLRALFP